MPQVWGGRMHLEYLVKQNFSVNFHLLRNDKSFNGDFFTIGTIDSGLSFHGIKTIVWSDTFYTILYTIFRKSSKELPNRSRDLVESAWSNNLRLVSSERADQNASNDVLKTLYYSILVKKIFSTIFCHYLILFYSIFLVYYYHKLSFSEKQLYILIAHKTLHNHI